MLTTGHLPSTGTIWENFKSNWWYTFALCGGIQVDIMFVISGYLLVNSLLSNHPNDSNEKSNYKFPSILTSIIKRYIRLLPPMMILSLSGLIMGDTWDTDSTTSPSAWKRIIATWLGISNYLSVSKYGSFTHSLCWSCNVDIQVHLVILCVHTLLRGGKSLLSKEAMAKRFKLIFFILLIISLFIRGYLFDEKRLNLFLLGQYSHFGLLMTDSSYKWMQYNYNHTWYSTNEQSYISEYYFNNMYSPTHTRFGPFLIGGILACNLTLQQVTVSTKRTIFGYIMLSIFTLLSITQILIPCFPPEDKAPLVAQFIATIAIRTLAASAVAFLLYRTLLPSNHTWAWPSVLYVESGYKLLKVILVPISKISYCSYLLHFRILMELAFQPITHRYLLQLSKNKLVWMTIESNSDRIENGNEGIVYLRYLFIFGFTISLVLSYILYTFVEKPCRQLSNQLFQSKSKKN
jgi:peptidoglycan/LPS O-acetylase OafA/YrhL